MDRTTKVIALISFANIILICVASSYIPSTTGTIPQDMDLATFQKQQQEIIYASLPFKLTMGGLGSEILIIVFVAIRLWIINKREKRIYITAVNIKPILKVRRAAILPEPVQATEVKEAVQSPPAQVLQDDFELLELKPQAQLPQAQLPQKKIQYPGELRRTFKYPPPYDVLNK